MIYVEHSKSGFREDLNGINVREVHGGVIVDLYCSEDNFFEEDETDIMIEKLCRYLNGKYFNNMDVVGYRGVIVNRVSEYKNGKKKSEQSEFTYQFNGQTYRGKSVKNSRHHCQKGSQIQLLINGNAPEKYLVTSNLVTVFILIAAGLGFLLVFVPMVYRHDPKNPNDKWNMMMKKVESLYKNRGV